ncbi:hypothetical protein GYMLUDRAFT_425502 [Collybiopsis luxurians FD-317 M1]|uniref:Uncharacterized protein n=1 Tax=Collybiopsis luxurians FD-317 M1 TaxID=944289 RepID=A0A0D0C732_9AGAR|nr:hypothetical protein GYMLUDRAFT_425502 [Collybiopsis luxurians FD-317 M1]
MNDLHDQANIKTVFIESTSHLPKGSTLKLNKVILHRIQISYLTSRMLEPHLSRGLQVAKLTIVQSHLFREEFGVQRFPGFREIDLFLYLYPPTLCWLHEFTLAHPMLRKITFIDQTKLDHSRDILAFPFLAHFSKILQQQRGLIDNFNIVKLVISRDTLTPNSEDWYVSGLSVVLVESLLPQLFSIIGSSLPKLLVLTLEFKTKHSYHIDELISLLRKLPSLRTLGLRLAFNRLHFGEQKPWMELRSAVPNPAGGRTKVAPGITAEAGMLWYANRIAQSILSIEAFFIHEQASDCRSGYWTANGWFTVQGGSRDVVGTLKDDRRDGWNGHIVI